MTLAEFKTEFDVTLTAFFDQKMALVTETIEDDFLVSLIEQARIITLSGGKRVRPYAVDLMYRSAGGITPHASTNVLNAIELFHVFCLIHDDVMDRGAMRHNQASVHTFAEKQLREHNRIGDFLHVANSQAVLIGDLIHGWTYELWESSELQGNAAKLEFMKTVQDVILGQMIDLDITTRDIVSTALLHKKNLLKTARYTFISPLKIGASLANNTDLLPFCETFGTALGLAFQIKDDLIDVVPNTGKTRFKDLPERQHTFLTQHILEHGTPEQKLLLKHHFGNPVLPKDYDGLYDIFEASGAIQASQKKITTYIAEAKSALQQTHISQSHKDEWLALIHLIEDRVY